MKRQSKREREVARQARGNHKMTWQELRIEAEAASVE